MGTDSNNFLYMKKCFIILVALLTPLVTNADAVEIEGIWYNLINKNKSAEVINPNIGSDISHYTGKVVIPASVYYNGITYDVTSIGYAAFGYCHNLISVTIPNSVTSIGRNAFEYCEKLSSIVIPNSVTTIEEGAFQRCYSLSSLTIPNSVTNIGNEAFYYCKSLESIIVDSENTAYDSRENCNAIINTSSNVLILGCANTIIPNNVTHISSYAFTGCKGITVLAIPNSVTDIGALAFYDCSKLTSVTIPSSMKCIESQAFAECPELTDVYCAAENLTDNSEGDGLYCYSLAFDGSYIEYATLHVPAGLVEAYQAIEPWSNFNRIIDYDEVSISANNIRTYSSVFDLDFTNVTGLKAYIVSGFSPSTCTLVLTPATTIPAGVGVLLKGEEGTYVIPHTTTDMIYSNLLVGVPTTTYVYPTDGEYTNFILANGIHGINFYTLSEAGNIAGGKAYLQLPTSEIPANSRPLKLSFTDEETTGINTAQNEMNGSSDFYDLQGRKVKSPVKGLYVVNGKKVIIK